MYTLPVGSLYTLEIATMADLLEQNITCCNMLEAAFRRHDDGEIQYALAWRSAIRAEIDRRQPG